MQKIYYLFITLFVLLHTTFAQENPSKKIEIVYAGTLTIDNDKYPGATIFNSDQERKVQFRHQGMDIWCDVAVLYQKTNQVKAFGEVFIQQGDSLKMNSEFIEYNGDTKVAIAKENVKLRNEKMTLETQELFFDRNTQQACVHCVNAQVPQPVIRCHSSRRSPIKLCHHPVFDVLKHRACHKIVLGWHHHHRS